MNDNELLDTIRELVQLIKHYETMEKPNIELIKKYRSELENLLFGNI
jgi:hypothetical protein